MICINIKYGCGHLGVATFPIEILRMSEIALDPHLIVSMEVLVKVVMDERSEWAKVRDELRVMLTTMFTFTTHQNDKNLTPSSPIVCTRDE